MILKLLRTYSLVCTVQLSGPGMDFNSFSFCLIFLSSIIGLPWYGLTFGVICQQFPHPLI